MIYQFRGLHLLHLEAPLIVPRTTRRSLLTSHSSLFLHIGFEVRIFHSLLEGELRVFVRPIDAFSLCYTGESILQVYIRDIFS